jgi:Ni/Co efflux regulator RcnB
MKKLLFAVCLTCFAGAMAQAQDGKKTTTETKVKHTSTPKQKVHNVVHPKHKQYSGVKAKTEVKTKQ